MLSRTLASDLYLSNYWVVKVRREVSKCYQTPLSNDLVVVISLLYDKRKANYASMSNDFRLGVSTINYHDSETTRVILNVTPAVHLFQASVDILSFFVENSINARYFLKKCLHVYHMSSLNHANETHGRLFFKFQSLGHCTLIHCRRCNPETWLSSLLRTIKYIVRCLILEYLSTQRVCTQNPLGRKRSPIVTNWLELTEYWFWICLWRDPKPNNTLMETPRNVVGAS